MAWDATPILTAPASGIPLFARLLGPVLVIGEHWPEAGKSRVCNAPLGDCPECEANDRPRLSGHAAVYAWQLVETLEHSGWRWAPGILPLTEHCLDLLREQPERGLVVSLRRARPGRKAPILLDRLPHVAEDPPDLWERYGFSARDWAAFHAGGWLLPAGPCFDIAPRLCRLKRCARLPLVKWPVAAEVPERASVPFRGRTA